MQAQHHDLLLNALGITRIRLSLCLSVSLSVCLSVCVCIIGAPQHPDAGSASRPPAQRSRYHQHPSVSVRLSVSLSVCLSVSVSSELLSILMQAQHHDLLLNALGITSIRLSLSVCLSPCLSVCLCLYHQSSSVSYCKLSITTCCSMSRYHPHPSVSVRLSVSLSVCLSLYHQSSATS